MKRWNGWGDETVSYPLPEHAVSFLEKLVGPGKPPQDASFEEVLGKVPPSRLPTHPRISQENAERLRHARGQSLPDWIALRSGNIPAYPDGVAFPATSSEVRELIRFGHETGAVLIPYGGGTSVVGHINPLPDELPVITVDLGRMNSLHHFDEENKVATFGAGIAGPDLEAQLRSHGCTLGHFPQSFEYSTLGGWVATRSSGQQSLGYGRIEALFVGGKLETPTGTLLFPTYPASAAGPSIKEMALGSEGRLGIFTEISVRVRSVPDEEEFQTVFFRDFEEGQGAAREMAQSGIPLSMLRLSTAKETETTFALAGHERLLNTLEKYLSMRGIREGKSLLLIGFVGLHPVIKASRRKILHIARKHRGVHIGRTFGRQWHKNRFRSPYLRNTLWEMGYAIDTLETATEWKNVSSTISAIESALASGLQAFGERIHVFTHLSHLYPNGSSIYTTYVFRIAKDPYETLSRWQNLKKAASEAIVAQGGTISHQHGVGVDHLQYLEPEKGPLGMKALRDLCDRFDPKGIMNPGKLIL